MDPPLPTNPQWKKYQTQIDRSLQSFESIKEWADFISFLSKLLKTFQAFPAFTEIPRKLTIAKRLAQCLTPALPSGVHQRALDVYAYILDVIGPEGLKRDLLIWSSGLFPFFQYASTSAKPMLLNIYEKYYLPLHTSLLPAIKAFLLALLPGLEEETGEYFEKVMYLLDFVSSTVSPPVFFQNMWMILISTPGARTNVLCYLAKRMPSFTKGEDITPVVGLDVGLMIRAFAASLEDDNLLVQRGTLDLLVTALRLDGAASSQYTNETDRKMLMRSTLTVVLRRDLSLSRRLYSWLLGPEGSSEDQVEYLTAYALDVLKDTLLDEMRNVSPDSVEPQRPYRIFISLLDKWEIGYSLTNALILDALKALKAASETSGLGSECLMTGSTLYEAVDPFLTWRGLFQAVVEEFQSEEDTPFSALELITFMIKSFPKQDDEVQSIHLPILLGSLLDILHRILQQPTLSPSQPVKITLALRLILLIIPLIPTDVFLFKPEQQQKEEGEETDSGGAFDQATLFYASSTDLQPPPSIPSAFRGTAMFARLMDVLLSVSEGMVKRSDELGEMSVREVGRVVSGWIELGDRIGFGGREVPVVVGWDRDRWFLNVARLLKTVLRFLTPNRQVYHIPAVRIMWDLHQASSVGRIEPVLLMNMLDKNLEKRLDAIYAFGVIWRLSEEPNLSTHTLDGPIFLILDTLHASNASLRRAGETWLRCNLQSYIRMLDPIMCILLDPSIVRTAVTLSFSGKEIQGSRYDRSIDHARLNYVLESLTSLCRFGGQALNRVIRATPISEGSERLQERAGKAKILHSEASFMDVLLELLLQFVQSEPSPALSLSLGSANGLLQLNALETVQSILSRGEISSISHKITETVVVAKLLYCIHESKLDIQNQLLHALQSIVAVSSSPSSSTSVPVQHRKTSSIHGLPPSLSNPASAFSSVEEKRTSTSTISESFSPLLLQTLVEGISLQSNRPVLQHWIDFLLITTPHFQGHLRPLLYPLCDCLIRELRLLAGSIREVTQRVKATLQPSESEIVMLLNALEKVVSLAVPSNLAISSSSSPTFDKRFTETTSGLFGYVSNVFTELDMTRPSTPDGGALPKSAGLRCLDDAVRLLHTLWTASTSFVSTRSPSAATGLQHLCDRVQERARKSLEHFYRLQPSGVVRVLAECWSTSHNSRSGSCEILDVLAPSAQTAVSIMCQLLSRRLNVTGKARSSEDEADVIIYIFLEAYLSQLEGPIAVQVWGTYFALAKDVLSTISTTASRTQIFYTFRCLTALAEKVATTSALEDRKMRRDLQDTYSKLLDALAGLASRSFDGQNAVRRRTRDVMNGHSSPAMQTPPLEEKSITFGKQPETSYTAIAEFLSRKTVPNLRSFLDDSDKVFAACSTLCSQVVAPALRSRTKSLDIDPTALSILVGITRIPGSIKAWRAPVTEAFMNDSRFFNGSPSSGARWKPLVSSLVDHEKDRFAELITRAVAAPSANIFSNRESEMLLRSLNIRRISFVLFAAEKNHFLNQLPHIQESLVETLRMTGLSPIVRAEVYLCLRILICRMAARDLTNLWPIILTELLRVFEQLMDELPPDESELLPEILAACKFLDLLLVIQSEDFQIHQWAFVRDTPMSLEPDQSDAPGSLMDQLAELIRESPHFNKNDGSSLPLDDPLSNASTSLRRPKLSYLQKIESISELEPFFAHASTSAYDGLYSGAEVDWAAVDEGLGNEMFEGSETV